MKYKRFFKYVMRLELAAEKIELSIRNITSPILPFLAPGTAFLICPAHQVVHYSLLPTIDCKA